MRAVLVYGFVAFYFLISIRLTANIHYCGGKIRAISFVGFEKQKSCCKGGVMKKGCCKNVSFSLKKNSEDQRILLASPFFAQTIVLPPEQVAEPVETAHFVPRVVLPSVHAPPPEAFPPVFLKNCVFII